MPDNCFRRHHRLRKASEFRNVFGKGRKFVTAVLVFHYLKTNLPESRLGLAVSKRVGKASKRNLVKRRIREVFREKKNGFPHSYDLVVYPRKGIMDRPIEDYRKSFEILLSSIAKKNKLRPVL